MLTPWGYEIIMASGQTVPDILTLAEFNTLTCNRFATDPNAASAVAAATAAVRNYCGWHVAPSLRVKVCPPVSGVLLRLPFMAMSTVYTVKEYNTEVANTKYEHHSAGMIRKIDGGCWPTRWNAVEVEAQAGYDADALLKQVCAQIAGTALSAPVGVRAERAGNVSIDYNTTAAGVAGGVAITEREAAVLQPFRVQGVF